MLPALLLLVLLLVHAGAAPAGTLNLRWNACFGDGGVVNRTFACNANSGSEQLVASFILPAPADGVVAIDAFVDMTFGSSPLPEWWQLGAGCRPLSLLTAATLPAGASACIDFAPGFRDTYFIYQLNGPLSRLEVLSPLIPRDEFSMSAGQEYLAFTATIDHQKTVGAGACGGCLVPACMGFNRLDLLRASPNGNVVIQPFAVDQVATWQGARIIPFCQGITPVRRSTWGDVKALYR